MTKIPIFATGITGWPLHVERRRSFDNRRVFADIDNNIVENPVHERRLSKGFLDEILYLQTYGGKPQMQIANKSKTPYV